MAVALLEILAYLFYVLVQAAELAVPERALHALSSVLIDVCELEELLDARSECLCL